LSGHEPRWKKKEIVSALEHALGMRLSGANEILAIRAAGKQRPKVDTGPLFERYLNEMDALVRYVDTLQG